MRYPHIAARLFDTPLLIEPQKLETVLAALGPRLDANVDWGALIQAKEAYRTDARYTVADGVAIIPVLGTLVHRGSWLGAQSGLTSYEGLERQIAAALAQPDVASILLDIDSPGGEVAGAFDLGDFIATEVRGRKPIRAVASDLAASAAYLLAASTDDIAVTRTGRLGSIGVATAHIDVSQALEERGVRLTYIYAGEHKIDGNRYEPLPKSVRERLQGEIDKVYRLFTGAVGRYREMDEQRVIDTQALTYMGSDAVEVGLADRVGTAQSVFAELVTPAGGSRQSFITAKTGEQTMSEMKPQHNESGAAPSDKARRPDDADRRAELEAAEARGYERGHAEGLEAGKAQGAEAERARVQSILGHAEAQGRERFARHLAFATAMSAEQAGEMLAAAAKEAPARPASRLDQAMAAIEQPQVGASPDDDDERPAAQILTDYKAAVGGKG